MSIRLDGENKAVEYNAVGLTKDAVRAVFKNSEVDNLFDRNWHKIALSVEAKQVTLFLDCKKIQTLPIEDREDIDIQGKTVIGKRLYDSVPIDVSPLPCIVHLANAQRFAHLSVVIFFWKVKTRKLKCVWMSSTFPPPSLTSRGWWFTVIPSMQSWSPAVICPLGRWVHLGHVSLMPGLPHFPLFWPQCSLQIQDMSFTLDCLRQLKQGRSFCFLQLCRHHEWSWWVIFAPFQCPKQVVTEAPPVLIPTPTPTSGEQKRGPEVNCSCPAGERVRCLLWRLVSTVCRKSFQPACSYENVGFFSFIGSAVPPLFCFFYSRSDRCTWPCRSLVCKGKFLLRFRHFFVW